MCLKTIFPVSMFTPLHSTSVITPFPGRIWLRVYRTNQRGAPHRIPAPRTVFQLQQSKEKLRITNTAVMLFVRNKEHVSLFDQTPVTNDFFSFCLSLIRSLDKWSNLSLLLDAAASFCFHSLNFRIQEPTRHQRPRRLGKNDILIICRLISAGRKDTF